MSAADRQDGDYSPPVIAPARGGPVPRWNPPATMDNGDNDTSRPPGATATASASPGTEESGQ